MAKRKRKQFDLDIVIPVYGNPELLQKCLDSLEAGNLRTRLILVDDQGPDQDKLDEVYQSLNGTSRLVRHNENKGFAKTVNDGIKVGLAPLVLILNTDVELEPGAIQVMASVFEDKEVGIVGPKLLFPLDSTDPTRPAGKIQHAGLGINFKAQVVHLNISWSSDNPKVNERRELQAVGGACVMFRRKVFKDVLDFYRKGGDPTDGPFNEVYGQGTYEDVEICLVAREQGWKVIYTPDAVGYHHVGASEVTFPLGRNEHIFKARCGAVIAWDEWRYA